MGPWHNVPEDKTRWPGIGRRRRTKNSANSEMRAGAEVGGTAQGHKCTSQRWRGRDPEPGLLDRNLSGSFV